MTNVTELTKKQLIAAAKKANLEGYSRMNKEQLVAALTPPEHEGPGIRIEKDRPTQNGVTRPSEGGKCRAVWDALDSFRSEMGSIPSAKDVAAIAADEGWNPNNASIEYYQWRKFNGITGRVVAPKVETETETA